MALLLLFYLTCCVVIVSYVVAMYFLRHDLIMPLLLFCLFMLRLGELFIFMLLLCFLLVAMPR